jgi:AsmA protein
VKRSTKIVVALVIFVVAVAALIPLIVGAEKIRPALERQLTTSLGRKVKFGDLSFPVFTGSLVTRDVRITDDPGFSAAPFLTAKEVRIGVALGPLIFSRQVKLRSFRIESPQINVIRAANGT